MTYPEWLAVMKRLVDADYAAMNWRKAKKIRRKALKASVKAAERALYEGMP